MKWFWNLVQSEPASAAAVVRVTMLLLTAFGFGFSPAQMAATMLFTETLLTFLTRRSVTANINLPQPGTGTTP
jgi:hypothetical protein